MQTDDRGTDLRPPIKRGLPIAAILILVLLVAALGRLLWQRGGELTPAPAPAASAPLVAASAPAVTAAASAASGPLYPLPSTEATAEGPVELPAALEALMGSKAVATFLQLEDFPRRVVATVDNLERPQASARLWPVQRTPDRFKVISQNETGRTVIDPDNALRYAPLVLLAETVNLNQLVDLYQRMYPTLQASYEELGYPGRHFNDRLIQVIDHLLATPEVQEPLEVVMPAINSPTPPPRPWVLYQFADPALESLSAGQKILLRVGPVNARRLKARLTALRALLVAPGG